MIRSEVASTTHIGCGLDSKSTRKLRSLVRSASFWAARSRSCAAERRARMMRLIWSAATGARAKVNPQGPKSSRRTTKETAA